MEFFPELEEFGWCPFARVTDKPCILCGGTRAVLSFSRGDFDAAWHFHPIVTLLLPVGAIALAWCCINLVYGSRNGVWISVISGNSIVVGPRKFLPLIVGGSLLWMWNFGRW